MLEGKHPIGACLKIMSWHMFPACSIPLYAYVAACVRDASVTVPPNTLFATMHLYTICS